MELLADQPDLARFSIHSGPLPMVDPIPKMDRMLMVDPIAMVDLIPIVYPIPMVDIQTHEYNPTVH